MRPKDLKCPFSWEQRRPLISEGLFYVPKRYFEHEKFPPLVWESLFPLVQDLQMELCSGNGDWVVERAKQNPDLNWIAVEMRFDRVQKIWSKMKNEQLSNLFIVCGEALTFLRYYVKEGALSHIFINFPDPWPKNCHAKNRLIRAEFLEELSSKLKAGSAVSVVSDDERYIISSAKHFLSSSVWHPIFPSPHYVAADMTTYGTSYFERLWQQKGREIHLLRFVKS